MAGCVFKGNPDAVFRRAPAAGGEVFTHPPARWMLQMARHLSDAMQASLVRRRYVILNLDTPLCEGFRAFLAREGIELIGLPPRSQNPNP
jgi:hypothetical protein